MKRCELEAVEKDASTAESGKNRDFFAAQFTYTNREGFCERRIWKMNWPQQEWPLAYKRIALGSRIVHKLLAKVERHILIKQAFIDMHTCIGQMELLLNVKGITAPQRVTH